MTWCILLQLENVFKLKGITITITLYYILAGGGWGAVHDTCRLQAFQLYIVLSSMKLIDVCHVDFSLARNLASL